jgi:GST-like protein
VEDHDLSRGGGPPYNVVPVDIAAGDQYEPEFLKISPNNKMPAIIDPEGPDGAPIILFESGAILIYPQRRPDALCRAHPARGTRSCNG